MTIPSTELNTPTTTPIDITHNDTWSCFRDQGVRLYIF